MTCGDFFLLINPFNRHIKSHSNGPSYSNTVIDTLAVDGWAVTFGTARRGLGGESQRKILLKSDNWLLSCGQKRFSI